MSSGTASTRMVTDSRSSDQAPAKSLVCEVDQRERPAFSQHRADPSPFVGLWIDTTGIVATAVQDDDVASGHQGETPDHPLEVELSSARIEVGVGGDR